MNTQITPYALRALEVGYKSHFRFRIVTEEMYKGGWRYESVDKAPQKAQERLKVLETAGIAFNRIIVAHEAPKVLPAPKPTPKPKMDFKTKEIVTDLGEGLAVLARVFATVFGFLAYMFIAAIAIDPAVIVELPDGSWVEVVTWEEPSVSSS